MKNSLPKLTPEESKKLDRIQKLSDKMVEIKVNNLETFEQNPMYRKAAKEYNELLATLPE
ncbi:hypothetical protein AAOE16_18150 [Ekhidna sp. MALMAid0563]|uniref:hypothetical protein n=1 Tax=Ekhidna sp. MALMAid0563 TaxID=3143937 RepID=UPI0032DF34FF